jgi:hypothetical protein
MSNWFYNGSQITELSQFPKGAIGFAYKIVNLESGKFYIGKKSLYSTTSKTLTKKEILEWNKPGRVPKKKKVTKESDWMSYYGSNSILKEDVKKLGEANFAREILKICYKKKQLTYYEEYFQYTLEVLKNDTYNSNIAGRFYRKDLIESGDDLDSLDDE